MPNRTPLPPDPSASLPEAPPEAVARFAPALLARLTDYGAQLAGAGVVRGLIGPREVPRLWDRHLLNCAALAELIEENATVADIGTGAGLPGLVLALTRPDLTVILVEPLERRCTFLQEMITRFKLAPRVTVRRGKAHLIAPCRADVVTSRAVAPLAALAGWSFPHLKIGGRLLALKGERADEELALARPLFAPWGADAEATVRVCGAVWLPAPVKVVSATRRR
ncbi:MAG: 16S rRNA (guanine(527)-N(7))-methyltransferase RsmG [Verrucomicrobia bacterium]|nr:MAG: 16S rRNA (guanine(527)-N(7))-methyltransferase RsmG [Verrucomicrobiota bacterium]